MRGTQGNMGDSCKQNDLFDHSEITFSEIFNSTNQGILVADIETQKFTYANPAICSMLGYAQEELLQLGIPDVHPKDFLDKAIAGFENLKNGSKKPGELIFLRKDRSLLYVWGDGAVITIHGKKYGFGFFSDITEQKKLEKELTASEQKYRALYHQARIALYRTRISDGKMLECNEALANLFGYATVEECLGQHATEHYVDPVSRKKLLEKLQREKEIHDFEIQIVRLDGTRGWMEVSAKIYPQQGYLEGTMKDITASKLLTETEKKVLNHVLQGKSNKEIANLLNRSIRTVEDHRAHIMQKLHAHNLIELVQQAQSI